MLPSRPYFQNSHFTKKKIRDGFKKKTYIYIYIIFQGNNFIFLGNINNKSSLKNKETRNSRGAMGLRPFRASTSVDAKSCKIKKDTTFIHFASKILHISASKIV